MPPSLQDQITRRAFLQELRSLLESDEKLRATHKKEYEQHMARSTISRLPRNIRERALRGQVSVPIPIYPGVTPEQMEGMKVSVRREIQILERQEWLEKWGIAGIVEAWHRIAAQLRGLFVD